jgi:hypothetical protein
LEGSSGKFKEAAAGAALTIPSRQNTDAVRCDSWGLKSVSGYAGSGKWSREMLDD